MGGTNGTRFNLEELCFYGHEEGSGSLDTTLKSVYNVPATTGTQLEVYYDGQDYSSGSTITDKVGTATNATIANTDSAITFDSTYKAWTFGGTDTRTSNIQSSALASTFSGDQVHSVALWFKCDIVSGDTLFSITQPSDPWEDDKKVISVRFSDESGGLRYLFWSNDIKYDGTEAKITKDIWYHLCVTYSGGGGTTDNKKLYLNGNEIHHTSTSGSYTGAALELPSGSVIRLGSRVQETTRFFGSIANFRLFSKALNADQIKELYDYQKDYFLGTRSSVTLYKGHLGIGVAEPSGQLELAGDERIQEYPPRGMTGYSTHIEGHGVFEVENSSVGNSNYRSFDAFDKDDDWFTSTAGWVSGAQAYDTGGTGLASGGTTKDYFSTYGPGSWLKLKLPYAIKLKSSKFSIRATGLGTEPLKSFTIYGSKDNTNWNALYSHSTSTPQSFSININSTEYYKCFVIHITEVDHNQGYAGIVEWRLFGTPGPTTLDKGSLTLGRSLDVPRISRYDVDTETPRPEKLVVDFDTTVNNSPTDISGKGNHGAFYNGASYSPADKAFQFDGSNDYIEATGVDTTSFGTGKTHSFSFWLKTERVTGKNNVFQLGNTSSLAVSGFWISDGSADANGGNSLDWWFYGQDATKTQASFAWELNRWYHIGLTFDGSNTTRKMYIDGAEVPFSSGSTSGTPSNLPSSATLHIGRDTISTFFDGQISNFKLYNVALEPSEVQKLYRLGRTGRSMVISDTAVGIGKVPEAQLDVRGTIGIDNILWSGGNWTHPLLPEAEFYWNPQSYISKPFSSGSTAGSTVTDINGKMNGIQGNMNYENNYWQTTGSSSHISTVSNMDLRRDWTAIVWNKSTSNQRTIMGHGQSTTHHGLHFTDNGSTRMRYGFNGNDVDSSDEFFTNSDTWCQFAIMYQSGTDTTYNRIAYQNERLIMDQRNPLSGQANGNAGVDYEGEPTPVRFGTNYGSGNHSNANNRLGPIAFFGRVLSAGEIRSLYNYFRITWQPGGAGDGSANP